MAEMHARIYAAKIICCSAVLTGLVAATSALAGPRSAEGAVRHNAFGEAFSATTQAPANQSRVYVYRSADAGMVQPINIYLNGRYHASLMRGGFSEFCLSPGHVGMHAIPDQAPQLEAGRQIMATALDAQAGQPLFLRLHDNGTPTVSVQALTEEQAVSELQRTRRQIHTISRAPAVKECSAIRAVEPPGVQPPAPKPIPQRDYALQADALFEFGESELSADGFNAIETLIEQVRRDYTQFERIRVLGYTDSIGSPEYNKRLSQQRADSVALHLLMKGLHPQQGVQAEGRGSRHLTTTGCNTSESPANIACHAPNRRVVVVVYGLRR